MDNQNKQLTKLTRTQIKSEAVRLVRSVKGVYKLNDIKSVQDKDSLEYTIDVYIDVCYGEKIPEVAWEVQELIKNFISTLEEYKAKAINIHIQNVKIKED